MSDILAQAKQEMARHGYLVETTSLGLIAEVARMRSELGELPAVTPWRLEQVGLEPASDMKVSPTPYELRVAVDAMTDELFLHDLLMEARGWPARFTPDDKERIIRESFGEPNSDAYPFVGIGGDEVPSGYHVAQAENLSWVAKRHSDGLPLFAGTTKQQAAAYCWLDQDDEDPPVGATAVYRLFIAHQKTLDAPRCGS